MDQFRQIGEVIGSIRALMVLKHDIQINQKQCCLVFDMFNLAFDTISDEIKQNLKLHDKNTKWKPLEAPMKELHRIFKEGELYIKTCLEVKNWWGKAISLHQSKDCVEFHIHNLLSCFPLVIEAIELASEVSGITDEEDMQRRKLMLTRKYDVDWNDPKFFGWKFGKQYLVHREMCSRIDTAWKEDKWALLETMSEKKSLEHTLTAKFLIKKLNGEDIEKLLPSSILVGAEDYNVKRRLGSGGSHHHKEIRWLGESFALKTFFGVFEQLKGEISLVLSLSHPNVLQYLCGFYDEERKEGFLVMELMQKSLFTYIKENTIQHKRVPFTLRVAVDILLQIARGMEYLHSRKIYHGDLNPSNILLKARIEGYIHIKLKGFGLTSIKSYARASPKKSEVDPVIWYAPEVLAEQVRVFNKCSSKYTEKADVYSFAMVCFELLTGKVPFEDSHLQGDKMVRNIRAGERPLFPHPFPKYLANLIRKCWQTNPFHRPSFSSICRILRYIKKSLVINPDLGQPESPLPLFDYVDLEAGYLKKYPEDGSFDLAPVYQIPFQMFAYKLVEKEKSFDGSNEKSNWDSPMAERANPVEDLIMGTSDQRSVSSETLERKNSFRTMADQRSVFSDAPQRKSFGSAFPETPANKSLSTVVNLPRIITVQKSFIHENPGERRSGNAATTRSKGSLTPERKHSLTKPEEEKNASTLCLPVSETECPSPPKTDPEPQQNPEPAETQTENSITSKPSSKGPEISEKKDVSTTNKTAQKVVCSKIQDKKVSQTKKTKDIKPSKLGTHLNRYSSPTTSPARVFKECSSPASSPARVVKECSVPGSSPIWPPNICSLPRSSPLYPCARCSRMYREVLLSAADMSPDIQQRGHLSESSTD